MLKKSERLKKELGLFDVYAISTGAMFSSGFFLLPGLAAAKAGPAVVLAYFLAGLLILPSLFSQAELSTAMPRAGGTYYFLDRSLGPLVGTVGGLGTYLALALKSAFALVGMGAYLALFVNLPIKPLAVVLTVLFMGINIVGAKETTGLQRILVVTLIGVLLFFVVQGVAEVAALGVGNVVDQQFGPFMPFGFEGVLGTVGFVFVSYAGLTKVASVAEEVENPDRNIPLGMILSLASTTLIYVLGVFIMVAVLDPVELREDLTPVATAGVAFFSWLPEPAGLILIVVAAVAAFASTGNAGLMSASRYPLAMARDQLISARFAKLGRFSTPLAAIVLTAALMIACIVIFSEEGIAKLASAFQLFIFMLVNLAVIVMRESRIESYDPGYRSPLYPWMQIIGIGASLMLIAYMGAMAILFTAGVVIFSLVWYYTYARNRVARDGAIYHWFARLGTRRHEGLDRELRGIMKEKGLRQEDPFDSVVARASVLDLRGVRTYEEVVAQVAALLMPSVPGTAEEISLHFLKGDRGGMTPVAPGIALPHARFAGLEQPEMVIVRSKDGIDVEDPDQLPGTESSQRVKALFFLASPQDNPGQHLRILAQVAGRVDEEDFMQLWLHAADDQELKEVLLRDEYFLSLRVCPGEPSAAFIGKALKEIRMPPGSLVAIIHRNGQPIVPRGSTVLQAEDRLTIIGEPSEIRELQRTYLLQNEQSDEMEKT